MSKVAMVDESTKIVSISACVVLLHLLFVSRRHAKPTTESVEPTKNSTIMMEDESYMIPIL